MLLDEWMSTYDVAARYERVIDAPLARVWQACLDSRPDRNPVVQLLFALRRFSFQRGPSRPLQENLICVAWFFPLASSPREYTIHFRIPAH
jgi:hypothetical protein